MHIFVSDVSAQLKSGETPSACVRALLTFAAGQVWGIPCPAIEKTALGKPYFPEHPDRHFSLSHSKTHVLAALSAFDIGADIEDIRPVKSALRDRLFTPEEQAQFDFFEAWTLREAVFKLKNGQWLRNMRLSKCGGEILTPYPDVHCRVYRDIAGSVVSAACEAGEFPLKIEIVPASTFLP